MKEPNRSTDLELSIVVGLIEGGSLAIEKCLAALEPSISEHSIEVLVPYDSRLDQAVELQSRYPWAQFVDARKDVVAEEHGDSSREHHDILRAVGLNMASGPIVALLEDHGTPSPNWCRSVLESHRLSNAGAIGGALAPSRRL